MYKSRGQCIPESFWGASIVQARLEAVLRYVAPGSRILDIGSGRGAYTEELARLGFSAIGVDIYHYDEWNTKRGGLFVTATGDTLPFSNNVFNMTIAFEVIEHCRDPQMVLKEIARCTSERFVLSVPNCDLNNNLRKYDLAMAHWTDPSHCNFFTKDSIQHLLTDEGFEVVEMTDCYRISPNSYFWDTIRIPRGIARMMKELCEKHGLIETYWSSILLVVKVPSLVVSDHDR